jgi:hypothetical protein
MATERQLAANRRNAQLSTGPRSVEGKASFLAEYHAFVHSEWLLRRYRWVEADVWRAAQEGLFCDYRKTEIWAGHAFVDEQAISRLHRLRNQTQRLFHETLAELRKAQAARQPIEEPALDPEIGFVPSNSDQPVTLEASSVSPCLCVQGPPLQTDDLSPQPPLLES